MTDTSQRLGNEKLDRQDVLAVRRGDRQAFSGIVNRYSDQIYRLAYRSLGNQQSAEEAVQEVFLKTFRSIDAFDTERRLFPWIYSIALNHLRSVQRRSSHLQHALPLAEELIPTTSSNDQSDPEIQLMANSARDIVRRAIEELKPLHRQAFVLRHIRELTTADTATLMGVPENTVKTYVSRARKHLRKLLATYGIEGNQE